MYIDVCVETFAVIVIYSLTPCKIIIIKKCKILNVLLLVMVQLVKHVC